MQEQWKEFLTGYFVSTVGNVDSTKRGNRQRLKPRRNRNGYLAVRLYINGVRKLFTIHRLVAQAFIPNPEDKPQINHINGVKTDNRVENLEWCTQAENNHHAYVTGLRALPKGEEHYCAKLTNEQARYARDNPDHLTQKQLAKKLGTSSSAIGAIQRGKTWKSVGGSVGKSKCARVAADVRAEIKQLCIKGSKEFGTVALSKRFGIDRSTVSRIVNEKH